jgi:hypothetical protein
MKFSSENDSVTEPVGVSYKRPDTVGEPCSRFINRYAETSILRRAGAIYDIRAA